MSPRRETRRDEVTRGGVCFLPVIRIWWRERLETDENETGVEVMSEDEARRLTRGIHVAYTWYTRGIYVVCVCVCEVCVCVKWS